MGDGRLRGLLQLEHIFQQSLCLLCLPFIYPSMSETSLRGNLASYSLILSTCKHFCLTSLPSTKSLLIPLKKIHCVKYILKICPFLSARFVGNNYTNIVHHYLFSKLFIIPIIYHSSTCFSAS